MTAKPLVAKDTARKRFDTAFSLHREALIRFVRRRTGSEDDAADIVQEAYLRLLRYIDRVDPGAFKALLYRIAINLVAMRARELSRRHTVSHTSFDDLELPSDLASLDQGLQDRERLELLMAAIRGLPEKCRDVFVLSRFEGLSYPQIAERCGISVKMVEKQISKALAVCRDRVGDRSP